MPTIEQRAEARLRSIYSSQKRRAKKHGAELRYDADQLVLWVLKDGDLGACPYCGEHLTPKGFQLDHIVPLARGGSWDLLNLTPACTPCNRRKHALLPTEYSALLKFLDTQDEYMKRNVLSRLAAGGAWLAGRFVLIACLLLLVGCAHRNPPKAPLLDIPRSCITAVTAPPTQCEYVTPTEAICRNVRVDFACVKVVKQR